MKVVLKPRRARPFFARHPWVFAGSIGRVEGDPPPGAEVEVVSHEGAFVARGLFNPASAIRVRLYRWDGGPLDDDFWRERLASAIRFRETTLGLAGQACRLVFSEADGLSGLTVDRFGDWLVAQFTSLALHERREVLLGRLAELTGATGILARTERTTAEAEGLPGGEGPISWGAEPPDAVEVVENGLTYQVDLRSGQKTGFYLDQRENRRAVASYARGRRVLDLFCYTGGFSLTALKHGEAEHTLGIDSSRPAIEAARRHAVANGLGHARFEPADVFEALDRMRQRGERFGLVVCDPPKFARHHAGVEEALKGYLRLNRAAVDVLEPDGILATCSCSGLVERGQFLGMLGQAAELSGRPIQVLEQRGAAPDHPVSASCLETDYLKCLIARVGGGS